MRILKVIKEGKDLNEFNLKIEELELDVVDGSLDFEDFEVKELVVFVV